MCKGYYVNEGDVDNCDIKMMRRLGNIFQVLYL